ncbi:aldehyde dehydrogenase (NADP(+)) [Streptantibioticus silvisoli]|uniref:Aldehyde dehydrogenase (NADP(+)) n=1 Tax=Streptantibioticus silvisoli TaxID=2705255 RepID=A0ABT6VZ72_9ACTN|nr:aldehyde dehydrogenase (NADP(+)) [Streptantibioticus silvisoli]MDI5963785.1 aldehyde dehydrogenase (NADP(+)) [Streptantibioticus silvisoli]
MTDSDATPGFVQGHDPRTGKPTGQPVPVTPADAVDRTAVAAAAAFPRWRDTAPAARAAALEAVADALDARAADLVAVADAETALGEVRLTGEVARATGQLRLFARLLRDGGHLDVVIDPPGGPGPDLRRTTRPTGPVAVFSASNFPFAFSVAGGDTASALAAGCPVVVKAHEAHPGTSELTATLVTRALARAGAPDGVFAVVHGFEAGPALVRHPAITAVGFTGSSRGGLALSELCARRAVPIPFYGELGSVNPVLVLPGAARGRRDDVATGYAASLTLGAGQFCTNPGVLFVPDDQPLVEALGAAVTRSAGAPMLSERIHAGYQESLDRLDRRADLTLLARGVPGDGPWAATPTVYRTTAAAVAAAPDLVTEEHFGPIGIVVTGAGPAEAADLLDRAGAGQLTATVQLDTGDADDLALARDALARLARHAGRLIVNGWPTGVAVTAAQHHGGPYPATTAPAHTSVGATAIRRWLVPVAYQDVPSELLPPELRDTTV